MAEPQQSDMTFRSLRFVLWLVFWGSLVSMPLQMWGNEQRRASEYVADIAGGSRRTPSELDAALGRRLAAEILPNGLAPVTFVLSAGFLASLRLQSRAAARSIEAIERLKATPDELAEALRTAARKTRTAGDPPPMPENPNTEGVRRQR
jgi:hypothetical protein